MRKILGLICCAWAIVFSIYFIDEIGTDWSKLTTEGLMYFITGMLLVICGNVFYFKK